MREVGLLSREIVRRVTPLVMAGAAGAAGAVLAQRRLAERRKLHLTSGPQPGPPGPPPPTPEPPTPGPAPGPPTPAPEPDPVPPTPTPQPDTTPPTPTPQPGIATSGEGPSVVRADEPTRSLDEAGLEQRVRSALAGAASQGSGAVQVEVAGTMVVLRGQVDGPETIRELERTAAGVSGVEGVRVLLHLPGRVRGRMD